MKRKLIRQGAGGLTVCLPKKWTDENKLAAGQEVSVEQENNALIISGTGRAERSRKKITVSNGSFYFMRTLIGNAYKKGYDIIEIEYENPNTFGVIEKVAAGLIGMELLETKSHSCTLRNISTEFEQEYPALFKKIFYLTKEHMSITLADIKRRKYEHGDTISEQNLLITRYADYCKRVINRTKRGTDYLVFEYLILWNAEKISHEIKYLYAYLSAARPALYREDVQLLKKVFFLFEKAMQAYFTGDVSGLKAIAKEQESFKARLNALCACKKMDTAVLYHTAAVMQRTRDMVGPLFGRYG